MVHSHFSSLLPLLAGCLIALDAVLPAAALAAPANVTTWHNDNARLGVNPNEIILTPANVNSTNFGKLFVIETDGWVTAEPLFVSGLSIPGKGLHNVVYIATHHDSLYACDADDGTILWKATLLNLNETPSDNRSCGIFPELGIVATPVIGDGVIYALAMSKDFAGGYHHRLHALDLATGAEVAAGPVEIAATYLGTGGEPIFMAAQHFDRAGLVLSNGIIYTTWSSFCDRPPYTGWLIGYNTALEQVGVLAITPNGFSGAIWQSGAAPAVDANGHLFFMTGNGSFDSTLDSNGFPIKQNFSGCFLRVDPAAPGGPSVVDYFAPFNTVQESGGDLDLGSGGTIVLPNMNDSAGKARHLTLGAGKDGHIYIADRDNMGKFNPNSNDNLYQDVPVGSLRNQVFCSPAFFNGHLYYAEWTRNLKSFQFVDARLDPDPVAVSPNTFGFSGVTPSVSADGTTNGIVWAADSGNSNSLPPKADAIAALYAYDANDISKELYNSNQAANARDQYGRGTRFVVPTIANGKVYVATQDGVGVFGLFDPPRLGNISTRAQIGTGDSALIAGFIIHGNAPRKLIIRGIGPSIQSNGSPLPGTLHDPILELHDSSGNILATNDNWGDSGQATEIQASGVAPTDNKESAILKTLNPGTYTAIVRGVAESTGLGLIDFYDVSAKANSTLANISSRGVVGTGDGVLIGGFIVLGVAPQRVIVRAIGPDLANVGVSGALADPVLELHDGNGALLASNDQWRSSQEAEIVASGLQPQDDHDAAIIRTLPASNYTAIVRGAGNSTGIALVEAYALQ